MNDQEIHALARDLTDTALRAGAATLRCFRTSEATARPKSDGSPVTVADERAEVIVVKDLERLYPGVPVIAEEAASCGAQLRAGHRFFLVDALDGTREFASGSREFTVNIAMIEHGLPVFGLIYAPAIGEIYATLAHNQAAMALVFDVAYNQASFDTLQWRPISCRAPPEEGVTVVTSKSHCSPDTDDWLAGLPMRVTQRTPMGSSFKFCLIASGHADLYPRHGPTMEWDIAAGHAILCSAGGSLTTLDGKKFPYGKTSSGCRNDGFVAYASADLRSCIER